MLDVTSKKEMTPPRQRRRLPTESRGKGFHLHRCRRAAKHGRRHRTTTAKGTTTMPRARVRTGRPWATVPPKAPPAHRCTPPRPEPRATASGAITAATAAAGAAAAEANWPRPTPQVPARRPPGHSSGHPQGGTGPGRPEAGAASTDGDPRRAQASPRTPPSARPQVPVTDDPPGRRCR
jgi:hypothetical protein